MDIEAAKKARTRLEDDISRLIRRFHDDTGLYVTHIAIGPGTVKYENGPTHPYGDKFAAWCEVQL